MKNNEVKNKDVFTNELHSSLLFQLAGISFVGFIIGFIAGLSSSPVVSTLLTLIFTVIAGSGGLYIGKVDFNDKYLKYKMKFMGIALVLFSTFVFISLVIGISIRTKTPIINLFTTNSHHFKNSKEFDFNIITNDPNLLLDLFILKKKLDLIDVPTEDQNILLEYIQSSPSTDNSNALKSYIYHLIQKVEELETDVSHYLGSSYDVSNILKTLKYCKEILKENHNNSTVNPYDLQFSLDELTSLKTNFEQLSNFRSNFIDKHFEIEKTIIKFQEILSEFSKYNINQFNFEMYDLEELIRIVAEIKEKESIPESLPVSGEY